jgi:coproporphyrinogen III oxidase-like Fe-S oxidoreductase
MHNLYTYPLYRPPAEANNVIVQVTYGCSYNNCSFCSMYKDKKFQTRSLDEIYKDIDLLAQNYPSVSKVFLADGDALTLDTSILLKILDYLNKSFEKLRRVSTYASAQNILSKSSEELQYLYQNKLKLVYFGIETGDNVVLKKITKGVSKEDMIEALNKVSESGIKISATVILGLAGKNYTQQHIRNTADIVNKTTINYLSTLQLGLEDDVIEKFYKHFDDFIPLNDIETLDEQKRFIEQINPTNQVIFRSNHASNALHLKGTLPKDKIRLLEELNIVEDLGEDALIPKEFRSF